MKISDDSIISVISGHCDSWVSFYSNLFSACETDSATLGQLLDKLTSPLSQDQGHSCHISLFTMNHNVRALHSGDPNFAPVVKNLECALSSLLAKEVEGAKIKSKAQWIKEGEKPTRIFFR